MDSEGQRRDASIWNVSVDEVNQDSLLFDNMHGLHDPYSSQLSTSKSDSVPSNGGDATSLTGIFTPTTLSNTTEINNINEPKTLISSYDLKEDIFNEGMPAILISEGASGRDIPSSFTYSQLIIDDSLSPMGKFSKYYNSDIKLHRLYVMKNIMAAIEEIGWKASIREIIPKLDSYPLDQESLLRDAFAKQLVPLGCYFMIGHEDEETAILAVSQCLIPLGMTLFLDSDESIKKLAIYSVGRLARLFPEPLFNKYLIPLVEGLVKDTKEDNAIVALYFIQELYQDDPPSEETFLLKPFTQDGHSFVQVCEVLSHKGLPVDPSAQKDPAQSSRLSFLLSLIRSPFSGYIEKLSRHRSLKVKELVLEVMTTLSPYMTCELVEESFLHFYSRLCDDSSSQIRLKCANIICKIIKAVSPSVREIEIMPLIKALARDVSKNVRQAITENLGKLVFYCRHAHQVDTLVEMYLDALPFADSFLTKNKEMEKVMLTLAQQFSAVFIALFREDSDLIFVQSANEINFAENDIDKKAANRLSQTTLSFERHQMAAWSRLRGAFHLLAYHFQVYIRRAIISQISLFLSLLPMSFLQEEIIPILQLWQHDTDPLMKSALIQQYSGLYIALWRKLESQLHIKSVVACFSDLGSTYLNMNDILLDSNLYWRIRSAAIEQVANLINFFLESHDSQLPRIQTLTLSEEKDRPNMSVIFSEKYKECYPWMMELFFLLCSDDVAQIRLSCTVLVTPLLQFLIFCHTANIRPSEAPLRPGSLGELSLYNEMDQLIDRIKGLAFEKDYHQRLQFIYILNELFPFEHACMLKYLQQETRESNDATELQTERKLSKNAYSKNWCVNVFHKELLYLQSDSLINVQEALADLFMEINETFEHVDEVAFSSEGEKGLIELDDNEDNSEKSNSIVNQPSPDEGCIEPDSKKLETAPINEQNIKI